MNNPSQKSLVHRKSFDCTRDSRSYFMTNKEKGDWTLDHLGESYDDKEVRFGSDEQSPERWFKYASALLRSNNQEIVDEKDVRRAQTLLDKKIEFSQPAICYTLTNLINKSKLKTSQYVILNDYKQTFDETTGFVQFNDQKETIE